MMSWNTRGFFVLVGVALACGPSGWAASSAIEYIDVSPSVVMAQNPNGSNLTCIALDNGLVFVDTGLDTAVAAEFRKAMEQRFDRPTTHLLLTHGHIDHIFAMGAFSDVELVAASSERPLIERQLAIEWDEKKTAAYGQIFPTFADVVGSAKPFPPTVWVDTEQTFGCGDNQVIFATTGGHTTGSSYVWFPRERVLVGGDLAQVDKYPYFGDQSNDLPRWIETLKSWHAMEPAMVCPGHGRAVDKDYLRMEWEYFEAMIAALKQLKTDDVPVEEAVVHSSLPAGYWPEDLPEPRWWRYCISLCYRSL